MEWKMMKTPVKQEKKAGDSGDGGENTEKVVGSNSEDNTKASSSPNRSDPAINNKEEEQLESTKSAMCEVREENERLKTILGQIVKDYQSLQLHFFDIMKKDQTVRKQSEIEPSSRAPAAGGGREDLELVSLCLGPTLRARENQQEKDRGINGGKEEGLKLALDSLSAENSSEEAAPAPAPAPAAEEWLPARGLKGVKRGEEEGVPQAHVKRARVSVRARCDAPTMNDGCQWRKYGQKIAKGNPCPRAYYRCTVAPGCPVRKQVQRCSDDMSILITTYEGNHNHPLPTSATAMASTTAAAACMLTAGSSTSLTATAPPYSTAAAGLNFSLPDSSHPSRQFYLTNPCISPSPSQPTITLDLTNPANAAGVNRFSSPSSRSFYSPTNFSFSPSDTSGWGGRSTGYLSYGAHDPYYKSYNMGALRQSQESLFHSYTQKNPLTDTIAKAITSDPSFQSALAAAITSYVGGSTTAGAAGGGEASSSGSGGHAVLKWGDHLQLASNLAGGTPAPGNSVYMVASGSSSSSKQQGSLLFLPPSSKNGVNGSPRDHCI